MRRLALLLLLAGCGTAHEGEEKETANGHNQTAPARAAAPPSPEDLAMSRAAAATVGRYYDHVGRREWRAAFALREPGPGVTFERFVASFERYADYRATVGVPSPPAREGEAAWVQVPVQLYGRMRDGSSFGSVGTVTLKRSAEQGNWRIVS